MMIIDRIKRAFLRLFSFSDPKDRTVEDEFNIIMERSPADPDTCYVVLDPKNPDKFDAEE